MKVIYVERKGVNIDVYVYHLNKAKHFLRCDNYCSYNPLMRYSYSCYIEDFSDIIALERYWCIDDFASFHRDCLFHLRDSVHHSSISNNPFFTQSGKPRRLLFNLL